MSEKKSVLNPGFFRRGTCSVARDLLGCILVHEYSGIKTSGRIVETEAYPPGDPASHAFRGKTSRNSSMFLNGGYAYVYKIYGIHHCFNVTTEDEGTGAAVLIRALEPLEGIREMWFARYGEYPERFWEKKYYGLCSGPGKLCMALGIKADVHDGYELGSLGSIGSENSRGDLYICAGEPVPDEEISTSRRIGLSRGRGEEELLRWCVTSSSFLSRPVPPSGSGSDGGGVPS